MESVESKYCVPYSDVVACAVTSAHPKRLQPLSVVGCGSHVHYLPLPSIDIKALDDDCTDRDR